MANFNSEDDGVTKQAITVPMQDANSMLPDVSALFLYDSIVGVLVGQENERFQLHKALLCRYPFFQAAFEGDFRESEGLLRLPEQDPAIFRIFVHWLYTGQIHGYYYPLTANPSLSELRDRLKSFQKTTGFKKKDRALSELRQLYDCALYKDVPFHALVGLYDLAQYLQMLDLKNTIINTLVDVYSSSYKTHVDFWGWRNDNRPSWARDPVSSINAAWSASKDSNLCRLLVVLFCDNVVHTIEKFEENEELDHGFLKAAFQNARARWLDDVPNVTEWDNETVCAYHEHDGSACRFKDVFTTQTYKRLNLDL
ncbi:MAG: hypothetical protein Q9166_005712 [cf. Caloplaca sp. 2 TL-2023]